MAGKDELKAHERTYLSMLSMMKWGVVGIALLVALVIWLIS